MPCEEILTKFQQTNVQQVLSRSQIGIRMNRDVYFENDLVISTYGDLLKNHLVEFWMYINSPDIYELVNKLCESCLFLKVLKVRVRNHCQVLDECPPARLAPGNILRTLEIEWHGRHETSAVMGIWSWLASLIMHVSDNFGVKAVPLPAICTLPSTPQSVSSLEITSCHLPEDFMQNLPESLETLILRHVTAAGYLKPTKIKLKKLEIDHCWCRIISRVLGCFRSGVNFVNIDDSKTTQWNQVCTKEVPQKIENCCKVGEFQIILCDDYRIRMKFSRGVY